MKSKNLSENILRSVKSKGFKYIDLPSVIEANHIVQRSGENFRKFIFSFIDQNGSELCLRPDLTIASCLRYLENNLKGKEKIFYSGQAYRKSQNKKDSIIRDQVGFEIIGSKDEKNDDKEIINTSLKSLQNIKYTSGTLTIGNVEIFNLLISKLDIPKRWKLRLSRHFWREKYFNDLLKRLETNSDVDPTIIEIDSSQCPSGRCFMRCFGGICPLCMRTQSSSARANDNAARTIGNLGASNPGTSLLKSTSVRSSHRMYSRR